MKKGLHEQLKGMEKASSASKHEQELTAKRERAEREKRCVYVCVCVCVGVGVSLFANSHSLWCSRYCLIDVVAQCPTPCSCNQTQDRGEEATGR